MLNILTNWVWAGERSTKCKQNTESKHLNYVWPVTPLHLITLQIFYSTMIVVSCKGSPIKPTLGILWGTRCVRYQFLDPLCEMPIFGNKLNHNAVWVISPSTLQVNWWQECDVTHAIPFSQINPEDFIGFTDKHISTSGSTGMWQWWWHKSELLSKMIHSLLLNLFIQKRAHSKLTCNGKSYWYYILVVMFIYKCNSSW